MGRSICECKLDAKFTEVWSISKDPYALDLVCSVCHSVPLAPPAVSWIRPLSWLQCPGLAPRLRDTALRKHNTDTSTFHRLARRLVPWARARTQDASLFAGPTTLARCQIRPDLKANDMLATHTCQVKTEVHISEDGNPFYLSKIITSFLHWWIPVVTIGRLNRIYFHSESLMKAYLNISLELTKQ